MGTSGSSGGPAAATPLVPTWLDEPIPAGPLPGGGTVAAPADADQAGAEEGDGTQGNPTPAPAIPPPPMPARFQSARRNFSLFARSGGNDRGALRRAVQDYVRSGTRGSGNATRRMGASRVAAGGVLGVFRGIQRDGVDATLRRLNLAAFIGRPPEDVFIALTDVICRDGGSIDEGIARDAWLETVTELGTLGIDDIGTMTPAQMQELFLAFVAHAIETRLFQDIGANGLQIAADLDAIEEFEAQLRSYIRRAVRDSFSSDLGKLGTVSDQQIKTIVDQTYREAWDLLETWGDVVE
jgi:hypothetical protein